LIADQFYEINIKLTQVPNPQGNSLMQRALSWELKASVTVKEAGCIFDFTLYCVFSNAARPPFWLLTKALVSKEIKS